MCLNRVNIFGKIQRRGHNLKEIVKPKGQKNIVENRAKGLFATQSQVSSQRMIFVSAQW